MEGNPCISQNPHCETCHLVFKSDKCYKKHLITSRHKKRVTNSDVISISCICGKLYSYNQSLYVHHKKCTKYINSKTVPYINAVISDTVTLQIVQQLQSEKDEMREKLNIYEKEHEEMKDQLATLRCQFLEKHSTPSAVNNTNNNTNSHNNIETHNITNININAFGNENTDYLDDRAILACIDRVYKSIPSLLEKLHFDPNHPENHNIKINNKKLPYASVMGNNQKWKTVDRKDAIETMVQKGYNLLDEKYTDNKDKFSPIKQQNFEGFQKKFEADDKDLARQLKSEVEIMVLNGA